MELAPVATAIMRMQAERQRRGVCGFPHLIRPYADRRYYAGYQPWTGAQVVCYEGAPEIRACAKHFNDAAAWVEGRLGRLGYVAGVWYDVIT